MPREHAALVDVGSSNAFVAGIFLAAMAVGEEIHCSDPACQTLIGHLDSISGVVHEWPMTDSWRLRPRDVAVHGPVLDATAPRGTTAVGCFFTLGVDSFFTLLDEPAITHLVYVVGYDVPLANRPLRNEIERRIGEIAVRTGRSPAGRSRAGQAKPSGPPLWQDRRTAPRLG